MNPLLLTDFYKVGHVFQYPKGTQYVYSNWTPRKSRIPGVSHMVFFGLQYFILEYLITRFRRDFFNQSLGRVMQDYKRVVRASLGVDLPSYDHIEELWEYQKVPLTIKALPEGAVVPMRVPPITMVNTRPNFYWVTNFMETLMSACMWQACTSATLAYEYRKLLNQWGDKTGMPRDFIQWQGHDFSFRGMSSLESAILSGMGHLLSFKGTDSIPAILALGKYYGATGDIGGSIAATEHSVMSAGGNEGEFETFKRLITEVYPSGNLSIVSDTWNLWTVLTDYLPRLKNEIMHRDGKVVIRPDSGDPVSIICGENDNDSCVHYSDNVRAGVIELLDRTFGHTITSTGHKLLHPCVGAIYGDSITLDRANRISERLAAKGYASQCVLGIGSYTYQYNTRDTLGLAMKATNVIINGESRAIFKTPVTDDGTKNSAKGLIRVDKIDGEYAMIDQVSPEQESGGELRAVFHEGMVETSTLNKIRKTLWP